jgi:hypothetical protein
VRVSSYVTSCVGLYFVQIKVSDTYSYGLIEIFSKEATGKFADKLMFMLFRTGFSDHPTI